MRKVVFWFVYPFIILFVLLMILVVYTIEFVEFLTNAIFQEIHNFENWAYSSKGKK